MKAHVKQKSATELHRELSVLRQEKSESPRSSCANFKLKTEDSFCVKRH